MMSSSIKADRLLVLYASQTGNAEWIAKNIDKQANQRGFKSQCFVMEDCQLHCNLFEEPVIVFVSSTTGDGDPPDNAVKFWRFIRQTLKTKELPFAGALFTVCGIGDTNYSNFGAHPRKIEKKMLEMGGTVFYPKVIADEVEGLENAIDPWIEGLWPELEKVVECSQVLNVDKATSETLQKLSKVKITEEPPAFLGYSIPLPDIPENIDNLTALPKIPVPLYSVTLLSSNDEGKSRNSVAQLYPECSKVPSVVPNELELWNQKRPVLVPIVRSRCLTAVGAVKKTLELELAAVGNWKFQPGDAFGLLTQNPDYLVNGVLSLLDIHPNTGITVSSVDGSAVDEHFSRAKTAYELLKFCVDLTAAPRKAFFRQLAEYSQDLQEKRVLLYLCSRQGAEALKRFLSYQPTILDILATFKHCRPPLSKLLDVLGLLAPRYYSISNSPLASDRIRFAFNVVEYPYLSPIEHATHTGICTGWLDSLVKTESVNGSLSDSVRTEWGQVKQEALVPIFPKPSKDFLLPADLQTPVIMIGPGTGVSPFLGFLEHRSQLMKQQQEQPVVFGAWWLFYGCRNRDKDFLFRAELSQFHASGCLEHLIVSYSRDTAAADGPRYVQDNLRVYGKEVMELMMAQNAKIYVCGDAKGMAKDVNDCLLQLIMQYSDSCTSMTDAIKVLGEWTASKRYVRDIWQ